MAHLAPSLPTSPAAPAGPAGDGFVHDGLRSRLSQAVASPPVKRVLATRSLVAAARTGTIADCSEEVSNYFGVRGVPALFATYARLLGADLLTPADLTAAAGDGSLLTKAVRALIADAPEILTPFDVGYASKRGAMARNWARWDASGGERPGGPSAASLTALAVERSRDARARAAVYAKLHPLGDGGKSEAAHEAKLWDAAERHVVLR